MAKKQPKIFGNIVYVLFQTDVWKTKSSRVCFGIFTSYEWANEYARKNGLFADDAAVEIKAVELNHFSEVA